MTIESFGIDGLKRRTYSARGGAAVTVRYQANGVLHKQKVSGQLRVS